MKRTARKNDKKKIRKQIDEHDKAKKTVIQENMERKLNRKERKNNSKNE